MRQCLRVADSRREHGSRRTFLWLDDADDRQSLPVFHKFFHICIIVCFVLPDFIVCIIFIIVGRVDKSERRSENLIVGVAICLCRRLDRLFCHELLHHLLQLPAVTQSERVLEKITDISIRREHKHTFLIVLWPASHLYIVLSFVERCFLRHLIKNIRAHGHRHNAVGRCRGAKSHRRKRRIRIYLPDLISLFPENLRRH